MHVEDIKAMGFKQMHLVQVEAVKELIGMALNLAAMTDDDDIVEETEATCDELVRLFGGSGITFNRVDY